LAQISARLIDFADIPSRVWIINTAGRLPVTASS